MAQYVMAKKSFFKKRDHLKFISLLILYCFFPSDTSLFSYTIKFHEFLKGDGAEVHRDTDINLLALRFSCTYLYQMAKAIQYVHQFGLVHGDIKRKIKFFKSFLIQCLSNMYFFIKPRPVANFL